MHTCVNVYISRNAHGLSGGRLRPRHAFHAQSSHTDCANTPVLAHTNIPLNHPLPLSPLSPSPSSPPLSGVNIDSFGGIDSR